jgi:hypothetical protein
MKRTPAYEPYGGQVTKVLFFYYSILEERRINPNVKTEILRN